MEDLKLSIPASDLPAPGEIVERVLNGFHILIESTAAPTEELGAPTPDEVRAYDGPLSWHRWWTSRVRPVPTPRWSDSSRPADDPGSTVTRSARARTRARSPADAVTSSWPP